ncbi:MAG: insulinase family protein, partial [Alphaproteobacteria bacterium]|nr:insulinase family protein [Alphaproteobacteria bacterium]
AVAGKAMDEIVDDFLKNGPTPSEVQRAQMQMVGDKIKALESVSGQSAELASGALYHDNPGYVLTRLHAVATATPEEIRKAAAKWLSRPALTIIINPGPRPPYTEAAPAKINPAADTPIPPTPGTEDRNTPPPVEALAKMTFPAIERTTLNNGIPVYFARRNAIPVVNIDLDFDAGYAADSTDAIGTQGFMLNMLREGTTSRTATQFAKDSETYGASLNTAGNMDRSDIGLIAFTPNLEASLDLMADVALHPAFTAADVERVRSQRLTAIAAESKEPQAPAAKALLQALYGPGHPYGRANSGLGEPGVVKALSPTQLRIDYTQWLRPDNAKIFVVGDTTLAAIKPLLNARFGHWHVDTSGAQIKHIAAVPPATAHILLVDHPGAPQSFIIVGHVLNLTGKDDLLNLRTANEALGASFLSRINADLRETKGWAYYSGAAIADREHQTFYEELAPVQADKTGAAIGEILSQIRGFVGTKPITAEETTRFTTAYIRALPGEFERSSAVMSALRNIILLDRPDDYYVSLPARFTAMTPATLEAAARANIHPDQLVISIAGDAKAVQPQVSNLGLPVEIVK